MSAGNSTAGKLPTQKLNYLTSEPAAALAGVSAATIRRNLPPDATYTSARGDKEYPLWLPTTLKQFRAGREAAGE